MKKPNHNHSRKFRDNERMHPMMRNRSQMRKQLLHRESHKEMQTLILLTKIQKETKGISGYQLQEYFELPRGTLMRMLSSLEENENLETREEIINGRANKFYSLTEKGVEFLEELKTKWAERSEVIDDLAPFENYGMRHFQHDRQRRGGMQSHHEGNFKGQGHPHRRHPSRHSGVHPNPHRRGRHLTRDDILEILINRKDTIKSKEEAIDFLKGHRSRLTSAFNRLESRIKETEKARQEIDDLVSTIEKLEEFSNENLEKLFKDPQVE